MVGANENINYTKDVFISYSSVDAAEVLEFVSLLKNYGIDVFLDKIDIGWGESIVEKVFTGIETSRFVIVFISANSLKSNWVKKEIETAYHREVDTDTITLLPIISCPPDEFFNKYPFLRSKKYLEIDAQETIIENLITLLRGESGTKFVFNHQRSYHGPVWIRLLAKSENHGDDHKISIRWGPWYREI
ncbi:MAG: toll/interleukin-1 receptor domain-containing protein [Deltaproteobacteria bacterium]|jgi:hypothetical protein|nr:toll/interleukin-1 receptor domain-containing protein [Deltaproteobacteria bacterium]